MANAFSRTLQQVGLVVFGGLITAAGMTAVTSGGITGRELGSDGTESSRTYVAYHTLNAIVRASGSNVLDYPGTCIDNPLVNLSPSQGSGALTGLSLEIGNNPAGVRADVVFTKNCSDHAGSGVLLIKDSCSSTGCVSWLMTKFSRSGAIWNGADKIKVILTGDPTSSFTARLRGTYKDIFGE